jgi:hypothetical protein
MHAGEKEAQEKKEAKAQRKQEAEQEQGAVAKSPAARGGIIIPSPPNKLGVAGRKFKRKGIRLRKNHMVRLVEDLFSVILIEDKRALFLTIFYSTDSCVTIASLSCSFGLLFLQGNQDQGCF